MNVGDELGVAVGTAEGDDEGDDVGDEVGIDVDGASVGWPGPGVGTADGATLGT